MKSNRNQYGSARIVYRKYNKLDARFQYRLTGTGVSYRWYWSFSYVVLKCYLCGTDKELICINQASQLMCSCKTQNNKAI